MNNTIDFKTAKTIENMSRKIDGMERAVSGFFNKMSDIAERKYGDPQVYLAPFCWKKRPAFCPALTRRMTPSAFPRSCPWRAATTPSRCWSCRASAT